ncbi:MAG: hypothetical protein U1E05_16405 [Patescibacteria group bacterium]|nr:hypothetical protein [Patescibacteria group bacterium]
MGMFWRDTEFSWWWWYRAPIETQAMMIEAFDEVMGDVKAVEGCKVWHFFIDYLPKGTCVFEYSVRVQQPRAVPNRHGAH